MAYKHGVYTSEVPTSIVPAVNSTAGLPVVFGTAPIHLASNRAEVNKPILCYTYAEAVAAMGYSEDWEKYTLCETIYSQYSLYAVSPTVFVNVLDPKKHKALVSDKEVQFNSEKTVIVNDPVLLETLKVKKASAGQPLTEGVDYEAAFDSDGNLVITALSGGQLTDSAFLDYEKIDPSAVDKDDIIGGIDISTGAYTGLENLSKVFPLYRLVPGMVLAPGWAHDPEVAAVMTAKASTINGLFKASVLVDVSADTVRKYTDVPAWKNNNNYVGVDQIVCWPMVKLGDKKYHLSTAVMGAMGVLDAKNDDIPYESPSNKNIQMDGLCLSDGTEVVLDLEQANYLNGQGVVTALNFIGGWKLWGNRTGCYPANTDVKDNFICLRSMFNWHAQTFIQSYWSKVDNPMNKRLIDLVVDSENIRINGFVSRGFLLGGRIEYLKEENPTTDQMDGIVRFHTYFTPPVPARVIENTIEFDTSYLETLFG